MTDLAALQEKLAAYRTARDGDGKAGEPNNGGNMAGDELADTLAAFLDSLGLVEEWRASRPTWYRNPAGKKIHTTDHVGAVDERQARQFEKDGWTAERRFVTGWESA